MTLKYETQRITLGVYTIKYFRHGLLHRSNGPAKLWTDGDMSWFEYDQKHRIDGPAALWEQNLQIGYFIRGICYTRNDYDAKIRGY